MPTLQIRNSQQWLTAFRIYIEEALKEVAQFYTFSVLLVLELFHRPFEVKELLRQCYFIGFKSLSLVGVTGFIMGLVMTIQTRPTLAQFGAESWLPAMISVSIVREIGPVITAIICAGKIGSSISAELASMKVTEQIDAMEISGAEPMKYVVVTRVIATTMMLPLLTIYNDAISMIGSYAGVNIHGDMSLLLFFSQAFGKISYTDLFPSLIKTVFFGFAIGIIASYNGYFATKGTEGVGVAANLSVVRASLMIFLIDLAAVQVTNFFIS